MLPPAVLCYGKDAPPPEQLPLRAGPLSLIYEDGDLRYVRLGDREIVRRIYVAVRDHNWGTVLPVLSNVQIDASADSFQISYTATHRQGPIHFEWRGQITGDSAGTVRFSMDGAARSTFLRNRIGFCVLLPIQECAGARARIEHVDGMLEESSFPDLIAPQSRVRDQVQPCHPFSEMRALSYQALPGVRAEVRLEGEIFEMEDQRNWIDASFKIYGTPLRLPFPAEIASGAPVVQTVTLTLHGKRPTPRASAPDGPVQVELGAQAGRLPRIGLGLASHGLPLAPPELERLLLLRLAHLRVDLRLAEAGWRADLERASVEAQALGAQLEAALHLSEQAEDELGQLVEAIGALRPPIWAWLIFHAGEPVTSERWLALARHHLAGYDRAALFGGGTNAYFTDLNRARPPLHTLDLVCYSVNPQVHAFDTTSIAETPAGLGATLQSARHLAGDRPLAITPITLRPRFNPSATTPERAAGTEQLPQQVDPRQMSLFCAGWTLATLKQLAAQGAASATYYETSGWRGVIETAAGPPLPDLFRSVAGGVFPVYHLLADVAPFADAAVVQATSSEPLRVEALGLRQGQATRVLLANLQPAPQLVTVRGLVGPARVLRLDAANAEAAMRWPEAFRAEPGQLHSAADGALELTAPPYAILRIDQEL